MSIVVSSTIGVASIGSCGLDSRSIITGGYVLTVVSCVAGVSSAGSYVTASCCSVSTSIGLIFSLQELYPAFVKF